MYEKRKVLYVEDADADIMIMKRTINHLSHPVELFVVKDGDEALNFLHHRTPYANMEDAPRPHLIILDLSIPKTHGFDVLHDIKTDQSLCTIPVLVLTTSHDDEDCERSYREHANAYIVKPIKSHVFRDLMRVLCQFWVEFVNLTGDAA